MLAVLNDLNKLLIKHLLEGKIVRLGDFESFQVSVSGTGAETEAKSTASNITGNKIQFRPGAELKAMLATAKYEKLKKQQSKCPYLFIKRCGYFFDPLFRLFQAYFTTSPIPSYQRGNALKNFPPCLRGGASKRRWGWAPC